jgi:hypothetical protein
MNIQENPNAHHDPIDQGGDEINLSQVIGFFAESWKQLALGAVAGVALGLGGSMVVGTYTADLMLLNNVTLDNKDNKSRSIDFKSWRAFEPRLPLLAAQLADSKRATPEADQWKRLSDPEWWPKNVTPVYSLSKNDTKNLAFINKDLQDSEGTSILYLKVSNSNTSPDKAANGLKTSADFIRSGLSYLTLKDVLDRYKANLETKESDLQRRITGTEIELGFMSQKIKKLEELRRQFPGNSSFASNQVIDPKDSGAKYLPISTQLIAIHVDVDNANESWARMRDELAQQKIMRAFLDQAMPVVAGQADGLVLVEKLLPIEAELRKKLDSKDRNQQQVVDSIRAELTAIRTRFGLAMDASPISILKPKFLQPALGAGLVGGFLTLLILLVRRSLIGSNAK